MCNSWRWGGRSVVIEGERMASQTRTKNYQSRKERVLLHVSRVMEDVEARVTARISRVILYISLAKIFDWYQSTIRIDFRLFVEIISVFPAGCPVFTWNQSGALAVSWSPIRPALLVGTRLSEKTDEDELANLVGGRELFRSGIYSVSRFDKRCCNLGAVSGVEIKCIMVAQGRFYFVNTTRLP